jgi:glycosyltransferase involved in cell wall biosynthesis
MRAPPRVLHVSWLKRSDGETGGVEKFAAYLKGALAERGWEVVVISWSDMPGHERYDRQSLGNPDKAYILGQWLDGPAFGVGYDIAVSDGYWGIGITSRPVVPVVHGTWAEMFVRMGMRPTDEVQRQGEAFNAPNAYPVACSAASARELRRHYGRTAVATIHHGIDLAAFHPRDEPLPPGPPWIVLEAAGQNAKKGGRVMPAIAALLGSQYRIEYLNAGVGQEPDAFRRGHVFLHPTRHEGNAYACLEALATDLPIVTTQAGIFEDIPWSGSGQTVLGYTLPVTARPEDLAHAVRQLCRDVETGNMRGVPRRWAEANANLTGFADGWDRLLREIAGDHAS